MQTALDLHASDLQEGDDALVRRTCFELTNPQRIRSAFTAPTSVLLLAMIWSQSTALRISGFFVVNLASAAVTAAVSFLHQRRTRADLDCSRLETMLTCASGFNGAVWGAAVFLPVSGSSLETLLIVLVFLCACAVINLANNGPVRGPYLAYLIPLTVIPAARFITEGSSRGAFLAVGSLSFLVILILLHRDVQSTMVGAIQLELHNDRLVRRLAFQAAHDELTGLPNRPAFAAALREALSDPEADPVVGILVDLDRFTVINDSLGHALGDLLMIAVAERLKRVAGPDVLVARTGGDEFSILVRGRRLTSAQVLAERMLVAFSDSFSVEGRELRVSASVGLAAADKTLDTAADVLRHADAALHHAKRAGRGRVEVFDDRARAAIAERVDNEAELRRALACGEIEPWYQPVVSLHTGEILGAEALARWVHPTRGVLHPGVFIPLAEECGLIAELGRAVFQGAARLRRVLDDIGADPSFCIRVNVSAHQLVAGVDSEFIAFEQQLGIDPAGIGIEVTESSVALDGEVAVMVLSRLRKVGHTVSLDDFGTGYSSLSLVRQLPIDGIKIDRSFVRDIMANESDRTLVTIMIDMANRLGLNITAEGVEYSDQAEALAQLGCTEAQGFLWSKAVPAEEFVGWVLHGAPWRAPAAKLVE